MQRVDTLEAMIMELKNNHQTVAADVACHDTDLSKVTTEIDGIKDMIKVIDKKLDRLIERRQTSRDE